MLIRGVFLGILATALLGACATIPDITLSYYFPKAETLFSVTQTIGCTPKVTNVHRIIRSAITVTPATSNSADVNWLGDDKKQRQGHIHFAKLNGKFTDGDATVTLTPDGRLAGINATSTGEGTTVAKDVIAIVAAAAAFGAPGHGTFVPTVEDKACDQVDLYALSMQAGTPIDPAKPVPSLITLTYSLAVLYDFSAGPALLVDQTLSPGYAAGTQTEITLIPDATSEPAYTALSKILADRMTTKLRVESTAANLRFLQPTAPIQVSSGAGEPLELIKVALVNLSVRGHQADLASKDSQVWAGVVPAPTHEVYQIPIPVPATFGKTAFGLALSDYGSITTLHYGSNSAAPDIASAAGAIAAAAQPQSAEDRAKVIQGQADLIAQQNRLVGCQLAPTQCK